MNHFRKITSKKVTCEAAIKMEDCSMNHSKFSFVIDL
jgi:hypothetical protein